jgi:curved DNA-binding protein
MATRSDSGKRRGRRRGNGSESSSPGGRGGAGTRTGSGTSEAGRDFYTILGVPRDADADAIQRAYRSLARRYHPDVNSDPDAEERFKDVSEAYQVLSDPKTRKRYDRFGADFRRVPEGAEDWVSAGTGAPAGAGARAGARAEDWPGAASWGSGADRGDFGGFGGFRGFGGFGGFSGFDSEDVVDLDDIFGEGGYFRQRAKVGAARGADQRAEIEISLADAYRGTRRRITLPAPGGGTRSIQVTVPAGVTDGQRLRLSGQGGSGRGGGRAGDLYLVVRIAPDPRFRLDGRNVHTDLALSPWEAALGARTPVATVDGEATVAVPPGTSSGRALRLRGKGLPNPGGTPGDLLAHVMIMVPGSLSARERELFAELARISTFNPRAGKPGPRQSASHERRQ